jgi:hypothetical protein
VSSSPKKSTPEKRALILWALLVTENAAAFQNELKPEPDKADRDALEGAGLIKVERRGRYKRYWIEVTDKGWVWASEHLDAKLPTRSNAGGGVLQAWLTRLKVFMSAHGFVLADVLGPQATAPAGAPGSPVVAPSPFDYAAVRALVRNAYLDITGGHFNARALLRDIREKVKEIDRRTLDDALRQMQVEQEVSLYQLDNRTEITDADRKAAIYFGSEPRHILWIER